MGLVVIVILLSMIMLVVLMFVIKSPKTSIKQEYYESELATNTISALMRTTAEDCKGNDLSYLAIDCVENRIVSSGIVDPSSELCCGSYITDGSGNTVCEGNRYSCQQLKEAVTAILDGSLKTLNKKYNLTITDSSGNEVLSIGNSPCSGIRESSNKHPILNLNAILFLC